MKLISHRGNIFGPNEAEENKPEYIMSALAQGYDVEIDVWCLNCDDLYLGHDEPSYPIDLNFLKDNRLWCHAKNLKSLQIMLDNDIQCFWHQSDDYTLTSTGFVWTYPRKDLCSKTIIVCTNLKDTTNLTSSMIHGICSDYVGNL